jgi:hypothetical protein
MSPESVIWKLDSLTALGSEEPQVLGAPHVVDTDHGLVMAFDGRHDGLIAPVLPLAGAARFTVEMVFCPAPGGEREQRVLHLQEGGSENRVLIETRVADAGHWFLDSFLRSGAGSQTLYAEGYTHPFGPWYHVALVYDGRQLRHYVDRQQEMTVATAFVPLSAGQTSVGVRLNQVSWFRGMIQAVCFTPRSLSLTSFQLEL